MYATTYLSTLRSIEDLVEETVLDVHYLGGERGLRACERLADVLLDFSVITNRIEFSSPEREPTDGPLVSRCLELLYDDSPLRTAALSAAELETATTSPLLEVVSEYVLVPLRKYGPRAFAWVPLLGILDTAMERVTAGMDRLNSRAKTDCDGALTPMWSALDTIADRLAFKISIAKGNNGSKLRPELGTSRRLSTGWETQ